MNIQAISPNFLQTPSHRNTVSFAGYGHASGPSNDSFQRENVNSKSTQTAQSTQPKYEKVAGNEIAFIDTSVEVTDAQNNNTQTYKLADFNGRKPADFLPENVVTRKNFTAEELRELSRTAITDWTDTHSSYMAPINLNDAKREIRQTSEYAQRMSELCRVARERGAKAAINRVGESYKFEHFKDKTVGTLTEPLSSYLKVDGKSVVQDSSPKVVERMELTTSGCFTFKNPYRSYSLTPKGLSIEYNVGSEQIKFNSDGLFYSTVNDSKTDATTIEESAETVKYTNYYTSGRAIRELSETFDANRNLIEQNRVYIGKNKISIVHRTAVPNQTNAFVSEETELNAQGELVSYTKLNIKDGTCVSAETFEA